MNSLKIFINKYKKMPEAFKASFWFTICNIIQKGISLLTTPLFTRLMTTEQYGTYSVYQSWYSIVTIFATLNLYAGVFNNGLIKWPKDRKKFTSTIQGLSTTITLLLFMVYLVAMDFWNSILDMNSVFMLAMFMELFFAPAYNYWSAEQRFDYKYRKLVFVTVLMGIISPLLGVVAVIFTEHKAEARVLAFVFVQVCVGLIIYIYNMFKGKSFYRKEYWKFALAFNLPLIPHYLSQTILGQADRIMIDRMVGSSSAALYSVAYTISMMFNIVTNAINNSFTPYTYKAMRDKKYDELRKNANFLVTFVAIACVLATAFGPEIIKIFASSEYYEAHKVVPPVAMSLLFIFIAGLFGTIEFYFEETKFIMVASSVAAFANIALNYLGIQNFGYVAAAYTTLICYVLLASAHYIANLVLLKSYSKKSSEKVPKSIYDAKYLLFVSSMSIVFMLIMTIVYERIVIRYLIIFVVCFFAFIKRNYIISRLKSIKQK